MSVVAAGLAMLIGGLPGTPLVAFAAVALEVREPVAASEHEDHVAPERVCPGNDDATLPSPTLVAGMSCLIDYARGADGLRPLRRSPLLATSAAIKADDIIRCGEFSHTACGRPVLASFQQAGYVALRFSVELGENLATGSGAAGSPRSMLRAWLASSEHRQNLLNARWLDGGVALRTVPAQSGMAGRAVWVSQFGRREAVAAQFSAPLSLAASGFRLPAVQLKPSVRPSHAASGRTTRFRFLVTSKSAGSRRGVARASVFFAGRRTRTDARGQATIVVRLRRPGRYRAVILSQGRRVTVPVRILGS